MERVSSTEDDEFDLDVRVVAPTPDEALDAAAAKPDYPYTWTCPDNSCSPSCFSCWAC